MEVARYDYTAGGRHRDALRCERLAARFVLHRRTWGMADLMTLCAAILRG